ncbi:MAG: putative bifunctional diguanylate cyclase/phosphodiesterase [Bacillota bacterium]
MDDKVVTLINNLSLSYEISLAIGRSLNLRDMLDHVIKTVVRKVGAYRGIIWLWDKERLEFITGAGFHARGPDCRASNDMLSKGLTMVCQSGQPLVKTDTDDDFKYFCAPFTGNEKEVLLIPVGNRALIHLAFTYKGAGDKGLGGILAGVAPKLDNAIQSCLNHEKLLAIERSERYQSEVRYQDLVRTLDVGIYISNLDGRFLDVNPAFLRIFGFNDRQELDKYSWLSLYVNPVEGENVNRTIKDKGNIKNLEILMKRRSGETFWAQVTAVIRYSREAREQNVMGIVEDITDRKRAEDQLQYLATHDVLTKIPNRYYLEEALKRTVAKAKRGEKSALLIIDLDNFKLVNDTLGHAAGDDLLITLSNILKNNLRDGDILARLGGDEFAVLLEGITYEDAWTVAEKLRRVVDESEVCLNKHMQCFNLSISIGIIMIDGVLDCQKLLSRADSALYLAKEGGRNRVVFFHPDDDVVAGLSKVNHIIALIKHALKENRLALVFQPVVGLKDGRTIHFEALIRMRGDDGELITPDVFIPVAERFGLMSQIDRWVVQSSLIALQKYPKIRLFMNLSGVTLGDETLLEFIEKSVSGGGIDPSRIGFEITETAAVKSLARAELWIRRLKTLGCRFALDDFGRGFSSFSYLQFLPVDYLKIDGSFVREVHKELTHRAIVQAINTVAHTLGKKTIAEFVENADIMETLHELEIDYGQGYYLGRPAGIPGGMTKG